MGCGGSRPEIIEGREVAGTPGARPVHPPPRDAHDGGAPKRAHPAPGSRPRAPDDRVNSGNRDNQLHYASPRGSVPLKKAKDDLERAPAPPLDGPLGPRMYPKAYRNNEGTRDNRRENFEAWEIQRPGADGPGDGRLYEYPAKTLEQPTPFSSDFDFDSRAAGLAQVRPPPPNDVQNYRRRWRTPPNDPGPIRAVVNKDRQMVGAMYHPEGNARGYERARLEPLNKQSRAELARHEDKRQAAGRTTWPQRGSDKEWPST
ncbi:hypothetical protein C8A00DRAFT_19733 [Chaetomidium leptoderma]|uniref:Uncharacterized protein n=1 Tax=Chaetomidium leptoderma TaxID=669021 RepID=A0AAN6ZSH6_9PEZI|nr:hypothetical protein C8A00DRAFT_19733 [Chaetomidium leptoderma]